MCVALPDEPDNRVEGSEAAEYARLIDPATGMKLPSGWRFRASSTKNGVVVRPFQTTAEESHDSSNESQEVMYFDPSGMAFDSKAAVLRYLKAVNETSKPKPPKVPSQKMVYIFYTILRPIEGAIVADAQGYC